MLGKLHIIDVSIVAIYLFLCLIVGLYKSSGIKNIKEYAVGNRNFSTFIITSTIFATFISAQETIGIVEQVYNVGSIFAIASLFAPFNWFIVKYIYAQNIGNFKGCISMSEIMGKLYGNTGHNITSMVTIATAVGMAAIQVTAIGYLFNYFFDFTYIEGVFIGVGILTLYSTLGGIRSVVLTDVFQFLIFFIALPLVCGYAYFKAGGYHNIINSPPKLHFDIFSNSNSTLLFFSYIFWVLLPVVNVPYTQRLLMAKNRNQLLKSYNIMALASLIFVLVISTLGFSIRTIYPDIKAKLALYHFIAYLPPIFMGIIVAGILAVIMSTADSWLNSISVIISHDVIKKCYPKLTEKQELLVARVATCACSILAVVVALKSKEIFLLMTQASSIYYILILVPFTAGFLSFKTNHISLLVSIIVASLVTLCTKLYMGGEFGVINLAIGVIGSAVGFFGAHYWQVKKGIIKVEKLQ